MYIRNGLAAAFWNRVEGQKGGGRDGGVAEIEGALDLVVAAGGPR